MAGERATVTPREQALWLVFGVVVAAFFAIEVFMLTTVVNTSRELNQRMWMLECKGDRDYAGNDRAQEVAPAVRGGPGNRADD